MKKVHIVRVTASLLMAGSMGSVFQSAHAASTALPAARTVIYAGLDSGSVYRSADGGATWQEADSGLPGSGTSVSTLQIGASNTVYAGTTGSGVYQSVDARRTELAG